MIFIPDEDAIDAIPMTLTATGNAGSQLLSGLVSAVGNIINNAKK